ncbi:MAG: hypothetical protein JXA14_14925 [Anaerolineae bacterium]|nr:hypothetical protein [Anaerolineae bacterium]
METFFLTIKFLMFAAMEVFVVAMLATALILAAYEAVQNRVRAARHIAQRGPESLNRA